MRWLESDWYTYRPISTEILRVALTVTILYNVCSQDPMHKRKKKDFFYGLTPDVHVVIQLLLVPHSIMNPAKQRCQYPFLEIII